MRDAHLTAAGARPPIGRALLWLTITALILFGATRLIEVWSAPSAHGPPIRQSNAGAADYARAVAQIDRQLVGLRSLAAQRSDDWLLQERIAQQAMARARLTGDYADLAQAQDALAIAFAHAAPGSGPHLTQAVLALSMHRLDLAERMLDAVAGYAVQPGMAERQASAALRGDIAFARGHYGAAQAAYETLPQPDQRIAIFRARTGDADGALTLVAGLERTGLHTGQALAQLNLLRGTIALQRGDWDTAQTAFEEADRRFPGWWLVEAHRAQLLALRGRHAEAITSFKTISARNDDSALRDALASLYRARGDYANARAAAEQAGRGWADRLDLLPEAALGHAAEHELAFGTPARALALARRDFGLRPHGATAVTLGWALIANSRADDALRLMRDVDRSSWRSAEQHLVAARALAMLGRGDAARAEEAKALAMNPRALDSNAALLWFGH